MPRNPAWAREELIPAMELYVQEGILDDLHPRVVELSKVLNRLDIHRTHRSQDGFRNPNGVAMKLANIARLDPNYAGKGLSGGGKLEAEIWEEFANDPIALRREAELIRRSVRG